MTQRKDLERKDLVSLDTSFQPKHEGFHFWTYQRDNPITARLMTSGARDKLVAKKIKAEDEKNARRQYAAAHQGESAGQHQITLFHTRTDWKKLAAGEKPSRKARPENPGVVSSPTKKSFGKV